MAFRFECCPPHIACLQRQGSCFQRAAAEEETCERKPLHSCDKARLQHQPRKHSRSCGVLVSAALGTWLASRAKARTSRGQRWKRAATSWEDEYQDNLYLPSKDNGETDEIGEWENEYRIEFEAPRNQIRGKGELARPSTDDESYADVVANRKDKVEYLVVDFLSPTEIRKLATSRRAKRRIVSEVTEAGLGVPGGVKCQTLFGWRDNTRNTQSGFINLALPVPHPFLVKNTETARIAKALNMPKEQVKDVRLQKKRLYLGDWMAPDVFPLHTNLRELEEVKESKGLQRSKEEDRAGQLPKPPDRLPELGSSALATEAPQLTSQTGFVPQVPRTAVRHAAQTVGNSDVALSGHACRLIEASQNAVAMVQKQVPDHDAAIAVKAAIAALQVLDGSDKTEIEQVAKVMWDCADSVDGLPENEVDSKLQQDADKWHARFGMDEEQLLSLLKDTMKNRQLHLQDAGLQQEAQEAMVDLWLELAFGGGEALEKLEKTVTELARVGLSADELDEFEEAMQEVKTRAEAALDVVLQLANPGAAPERGESRGTSRFNTTIEISWYDSRMPVAAFHEEDVTRYRDLVLPPYLSSSPESETQSQEDKEESDKQFQDFECDWFTEQKAPDSERFLAELLKNDVELAGFLNSNKVALDDVDINRLVATAERHKAWNPNQVFSDTDRQHFLFVESGELQVKNPKEVDKPVKVIKAGEILGPHNVDTGCYAEVAEVGEGSQQCIFWKVQRRNLLSGVDLRFHMPMQDAVRMGRAGGARPMEVGAVISEKAARMMEQYAAIRPRPPGTPLQLPANPVLEGCLFTSTGGIALRQLLSRMDCGAQSRSALHGMLFGEESFGAALSELLADGDSPVESRVRIDPPVRDAFKKLHTVREQYVDLLRLGALPEWYVWTDLLVVPPITRGSSESKDAPEADLDVKYARVVKASQTIRDMALQRASASALEEQSSKLREAVHDVVSGSDADGVPSEDEVPMKSLKGMISGKKALLRGQLLGSNVDFSCRTVIVSGPELALDEVGLPLQIAASLFEPHLRKELFHDRGFREYCETRLENREKSSSSADLKEILDKYWNSREREDPLRAYWEEVNNHKNEGVRFLAMDFFRKFFASKPEQEQFRLLRKVMGKKYVAINRAPTLHRASVQAMKPVLYPGQAMRIHPLVTPPFNADFDGDTMTIHLALSDKAQEEFREIMAPSKNFWSPATGDIMMGPTQDMVLGLYYLTSDPAEGKSPAKKFDTPQAVVREFEEGNLIHNDFVEVPVSSLRAVNEDFAKDVPGLTDSDIVDDSDGAVQTMVLTVGRLIFFMQLADGYSAAHRPGKSRRPFTKFVPEV